MKSYDIRLKSRELLKDKYGICLLITFIGALIVSGTASMGIIGMLITGPIAVGIAYAFIKLVRGMDLQLQDMFYGFETFVPAFVQKLLSTIFIFLWFLLLIVPGIIKALAYSMAPYILADNPEMNGLDSITASKEMMDGHKGRLFCLYLSFTGWFLLAVLTGFIGLIFLAPYVTTAKTVFYQDLLDNKA
jgi:uncharacterized membrane protein